MKKVDLPEIFLILYSISLFFSIAVSQICLGILIFFIILKLKKGEIKLKDFEFGLIILLFVIFVDVSLFYKIFLLKTIPLKIKKFFGGWLFFSFYAPLLLIKDKNFPKRLFDLMILSSAIASIYGIFYVKYLANVYYPNLSYYDIGARGFYSHSLTSGNIWAMILILSIFLFYKFKNFRYFLLSVIIFIGLIFTFRRGPILYFLVVFFVMNVIFFKKKGIVLSLVAIILIGSIFFMNQGLNKRVKMLLKAKNNPCSSTQIRLFLWKTSIKLVKKYPFFGVPKKFKEEVKKFTNLKCQQRGHPHNGFLTILVYYGFFPFILSLFLFFKLIKFLTLKIKESEFALLGFFIVLIYLLESLTENNFGDSEVKMVFWFLLGIIISGIKKGWKFQ